MSQYTQSPYVVPVLPALHDVPRSTASNRPGFAKPQPSIVHSQPRPSRSSNATVVPSSKLSALRPRQGTSTAGRDHTTPRIAATRSKSESRVTTAGATAATAASLPKLDRAMAPPRSLSTTQSTTKPTSSTFEATVPLPQRTRPDIACNSTEKHAVTSRQLLPRPRPRALTVDKIVKPSPPLPPNPRPNRVVCMDQQEIPSFTSKARAQSPQPIRTNTQRLRATVDEVPTSCRPPHQRKSSKEGESRFMLGFKSIFGRAESDDSEAEEEQEDVKIVIQHWSEY